MGVIVLYHDGYVHEYYLTPANFLKTFADPRAEGTLECGGSTPP
jgi:hypothetical protein